MRSWCCKSFFKWLIALRYETLFMFWISFISLSLDNQFHNNTIKLLVTALTNTVKCWLEYTTDIHTAHTICKRQILCSPLRHLQRSCSTWGLIDRSQDSLKCPQQWICFFYFQGASCQFKDSNLFWKKVIIHHLTLKYRWHIFLPYMCLRSGHYPHQHSC